MKHHLGKLLRTSWLTLSIAGALGCGATDSDPGAVSSGPTGHVEQAFIPGAAITQTYRLINVPGGSTLTNQQVDCPSGSVVVGGGYLSGPQTRVFASVPNLNGWSVSIQNPSTSNTLNLVAQCLSGTSAASGIVAPASTIINKSGYGCLWASCPASRVLTAGGYVAPSSFRASVNYLLADGRWQVCGWNEDTGSSIRVELYPLCLSGVTGSPKRYFKNGPNLPPNSGIRVDSDPCPSGLLLGSGGYGVASRSMYTRGSTRSFQDATRWSNSFVNLTNATQLTNVVTTCLDLWQ